MFIEAVGGVAVDAVVGAAYENRNAIVEWGGDFFRRLKNGRNLVVLFGCGGTGKSTTGQVLSGASRPDQLTGEYNLSTTMENLGLKGRFFVDVKVPPGQESYREAWAQLFREIIASKRTPVVINVVCWGMHSPAKLEMRGITEFKSGVNKSSIEAYRERNLISEIRVLEEIVAHANLYKGKLKFITLVTKQDLWWPDRARVKNHYMSPESPYQSAMEKLQDCLGRNNFTHQVWSLSYGHFNHRTADGIPVFSTAAGYDDTIQNSHMKGFEALIDGTLDD